MSPVANEQRKNSTNANPAESLDGNAGVVPGKPLIFIVDDNPLDVFLIKRALKTAGVSADIEVAEDGERAVEMFDRVSGDGTHCCPSLILLDINLPMINGLDVLRHMRSAARCCDAKIIMVTSSDLPAERVVMDELGAEYFQKQGNPSEYMKLGDVARTLMNS